MPPIDEAKLACAGLEPSLCLDPSRNKLLCSASCEGAISSVKGILD